MYRRQSVSAPRKKLMRSLTVISIGRRVTAPIWATTAAMILSTGGADDLIYGGVDRFVDTH